MPEPIRLRDLLKSRRSAWLLALLLGLLTLVAAVGLLALSGWFISAAALAGLISIGAMGFDYFRPAAIIRLFAIMRTAGRYAERLSSHYAALGLLKDLRVRCFASLTRHSPASLQSKNIHSSDSLQRLVSDIDLLDQLPLKVLAPWLWALSLSLIVLLFWYLISPALLLSAAIPLALALLLPFISLRQALRLSHEDTLVAARRRSALLEPLSMLTSLILWQRWPDKAAHFSAAEQQLYTLQQQQHQLSTRLSLVQQLLLALSLLLLLFQGSVLIADGSSSVALLLAAVLALWGLGEAILPLSQSFIALGLSMAARDRLNQLSGQPAATPTGTAPPQGPFQLTAKALSARQNGALYGPDNISFTLQTGETLLISGPSGAGKSTLLQALANQLPYTGQLELNAQPYAHWQLQHCIGYLPQQLDIFDLSLAQNLRLADANATEQQLWQVLADVALADWARSQPQQLDTVLGEYGAAVSGGQARRIALARLLLAKRPVLLLDEPFSGLDRDTTQQVMASLQRYQQQGLLIIVSHQLPEALYQQLQLEA